MVKLFNIILIMIACLLEVAHIGGSVLAAKRDNYKSLIIIIPQLMINLCAIYLLAQNL